ncbi:hypothetical protein SAMN05443550_105209 [Pedobacter hartonius]|uniref:Uncharacterized protein n=1 Tax=Pedobacter hartonius TaxID=425514 RepID=A0A1H4E2A9_9SPHI|nr:hypothetical protein SAMN05443550_105209 [Pedobacter hartonius]
MIKCYKSGDLPFTELTMLSRFEARIKVKTNGTTPVGLVLFDILILSPLLFFRIARFMNGQIHLNHITSIAATLPL